MKDNYQVSPCRDCQIKKGYGGQARCSACYVRFLEDDNARLRHKVDTLKVRIEHYKAIIKVRKTAEGEENEV